MAVSRWDRDSSAGARCAALLLSLCAATATQAATEIGRAVSIAPSVSGMISGKVRTMGSGDGVHQDEMIQTQTAGSARLRFIDATDLSIGPSSTVRLDRFVFNPAGSASSFILNATKGAFRFATGRSNHDAYVIRTPAAVIGVRGTQFSFTVIGTRLSLSVQQGRVVVCPIGLPRTRCFEASPGQTISAQPNQPVVLISGGGGGGGRGSPPPKSSPQRPPSTGPYPGRPTRRSQLPPGGGYDPYSPDGYGPYPPDGYGPYSPGGYDPYLPPRRFAPYGGYPPPRGDGYPPRGIYFPGGRGGYGFGRGGFGYGRGGFGFGRGGGGYGRGGGRGRF